MSEESEVVETEEVAEAQAEETASEQLDTDTTGTEEVPSGEEEAPAKAFTQEELDAAVGKRLARERRKWDREHQQPEPPKPVPAEDIKPENYASDEEYVEALATRKAEQIAADNAAKAQRATIVDSYLDKEEEAREKHDDYEQVARNPSLHVTDVMAEAIQMSAPGPEILYHLGKNPKEAERIAKLSPLQQAMEIGRIEATLTAPKPKVSKAPAPVEPIGGKKGVVEKKPSQMKSDEEYDAWRLKRKQKYGS